MRLTLLSLSLVGLAFAGDPARITPPLLGYVFDSTSKSIRPVAGVPGAAAIEAAIPSPSKIENGFVSQNRRYLIATTLDGVILVNLETLDTRQLEGLPSDIVLAAWSADSTAVAVWSRSGEIQLWSGFPDSGSFRFSVSPGSLAGLAVGGGGRTVLYWNELGLFRADGDSVQQLVAEKVNAAAYRAGSDEWAAITDSQLLRSNAGPVAAPVEKAKAVAFTSRGLLIGGENAIAVIDDSGARALSCECDATTMDRLAGLDVFRLTGLDAPSIAIFDGDSDAPRILYVPTEGGRR